MFQKYRYLTSIFDRPEFRRMMDDIYIGNANCVIVKDLSRFGRDYIEAGRFIQKIFPALGVRFIAITDNYDSLAADRTEDTFVIPIKNFINDSYCQDISQKVKANQKVKRKNGDFIGAFPVYGYVKNSENKNQLVIDDYAADIVRKIYLWKMEGMSLGAIAEKLNELHILCPLEYKKSMGTKYYTCFEGAAGSKWAPIAVKRILTNPVYIGRLVQGKQEKVSYKVKKKRNIPENEWICVENTHQAIISPIDFELMQRILKYDGRAATDVGVANIFTGILFCGDCQAPMIRRANIYKGKQTVYYICQTKNKSQGCSRHSIKEETLKSIMLKEIKQYFSVLCDYNGVLEMLKTLEAKYNHVAEYDSHILRLQEEYNKYYVFKKSLYDDLEQNVINIEEFDEFYSMYEEKCDGLERAIAGQRKLIKNIFQNGMTSQTQLKEISSGLEIETLTRLVLLDVIEAIYIYEEEHLSYRFVCSDIFKYQLEGGV